MSTPAQISVANNRPRAFGLTPRAAQMLRIIDAHMNAHGTCPSYDEIAARGSYSSRGNVHRIVSVLEKRGYVKRIPFCARSLAFSAAGVDWLERHRTRAATPG